LVILDVTVRDQQGDIAFAQDLFTDQAKEVSPDTEITVLTKETDDYYSRPILSHGFSKPDIEQTIIMKTFAQLEQKSIHVISGAEVIAIDRQQQRRYNHA